MSTTQLGGLTAQQLGAISTATLNNFSATQVGNLNANQIQALSTAQLNGLDADSFNAINLAHLTSVVISSRRRRK